MPSHVGFAATRAARRRRLCRPALAGGVPPAGLRDRHPVSAGPRPAAARLAIPQQPLRSCEDLLRPLLSLLDCCASAPALLVAGAQTAYQCETSPRRIRLARRDCQRSRHLAPIAQDSDRNVSTNADRVKKGLLPDALTRVVADAVGMGMRAPSPGPHNFRCDHRHPACSLGVWHAALRMFG